MINKKHFLRTAISLVCAATIASAELTAFATTSKDLEIKTENTKDELNALNSELDTLSEELVETSEQIEKLAQKIEKAKLDLAAAQLNEEAQYKAMSERIQFMYEGGSLSLVHILFSAESMGDFLNKAEYVSTISDYDRNMLEELHAVTTDIESKQSGLNTQQEELAELQQTLNEKEDALRVKISSTSGKLAKYKTQLAKAKAAEKALKQAQDAETSGSIGGENKKDSNTTTVKADKDSESSASVSVSDVALMAGILQCEAGSSYEGMIAVGTVIMNRIESSRFPNTLKEVVYQPGQFGPAMTGKLDRVLAQGPNSSAYAAAKEVLGGKRHKKVLTCLYFNGAQWTSHEGVNIGGNIFW